MTAPYMTAPYIVFEGMNGGGKTAISTTISKALRQRDVAVAHLHYPSSISHAGQLINAVFDDRAHFDSRAMLWLFLAELADLEPQITAMRGDGVAVICDRHTMYSAFVYQVPIHGRAIVEAAIQAIRPALPTHTFIVDVPAGVALDRRSVRDKRPNKLYESTDLDKLDKLRTTYRNIPEWLDPPSFWPENIKILDGTLPIEENVRSVLSVVYC